MPINANIYAFEHLTRAAGSPNVVLIHGAGGTHLHWPPHIRRLPNAHVHAIDLPGHGKSKGRGRQSIGAYVESVLTWLDEKKIRKAVFVGHSMGGAIALTIGLHHPERVLALGLVGTGARLRVDPVLMENASRSETFPSLVEAMTERAFGPKTPERLKKLGAKRMAETRPVVLHSDFLACNTFDIMDALDQIQAPCLVLCGENDQLTPPRRAQYLHDQLPHAELQIFPQTGHMLQLEAPDAVARALTDFLEKFPH